MAESDLAKIVIKYLQNQNWDIYQEVRMGYGNSIVDIVAIMGNISWIIETKTSLSLALLEQAYLNRYYSNFVSIASPNPRKKIKGHKAASIFLFSNGIGHLGIEDNYVYEILKPQLNRKIIRNVKNYLNQSQKFFSEADSSNGGYWTPFKETVINIKNYLKNNPGASIKEVMDNIKHHYSSNGTARASILHWLHEEVIEGIRIEYEGKRIKLYLE